MSDSVHITVPLVPPSVNHYKMRTKRGVTFVSAEAKAYKQAVGICARGREVLSDYFDVEVIVFQGKGDKGDVDNYAKCVLDGLKEAGVIHSDDAITDLTMRKRRDRINPRTEITVRPL
jgi:Holliday junction resolvase RusA-like endonuclease